MNANNIALVGWFVGWLFCFTAYQLFWGHLMLNKILNNLICYNCSFVLFCLVWYLLFNGISTLFRLFNAKAILLEEQWWCYLTHSWEDKGVHTFLKGICPKVNVIARLEYELTYYDSAVHRFNHYTTRTPPVVLFTNS